MKSKIYTIDVQVDGEWKEWNGIDYAESVPEEKAEMRSQMCLLKSNGYKARRRYVREVDIEFLTVRSIPPG